MAITASNVNNSALGGGPVEAIFQQKVDMAIHLPQSSHGIRKSDRLLWVLFVEFERTATMSSGKGVYIMVCVMWISFEADVAVGRRFEQLIERAVDNSS